jgi:hypothetical protein
MGRIEGILLDLFVEGSWGCPFHARRIGKRRFMYEYLLTFRGALFLRNHIFTFESFNELQGSALAWRK